MKNQPKWREEWNRLVGDHKYLAIKNWDSYQTFTSSGVPAHWIKDYVNADFDEPLAIFEGGLLNRLRRFRGRLGHNIPTNLQLILSGCAVLGQDRHNVGAALVQLVGRGRLVPTNQQDMVSKKRIEEKKREEYIPIEPQGEEKPTLPAQETPETPTPAHSDAQALCDLLSSYSGNVVKPDWLKYASAILEATSLDKLKPLLEWMFVEDKFWGSVTHNMKNLWDHLQAGNLLAKYNAVRKLKKKQIAKAKDEITAPGAHGHDSGLEF